MTAEQALRQAEARLDLAIRGARVCLFEQDRELRYTWVSGSLPAADPDEVVGRTDDEVMAGCQPPPAAWKRQVLESGVAQRQDVRIQPRPDWEPRWGEVTAEPLRDEKGQVVGLRGAWVDTTASREAEARLQTLRGQTAEQTHELRRLALALTQAEARERRRIAQILHDRLQQLLVAAKYSLAVLASEQPAVTHVRVAERASRLIDEAIQIARSCTAEINPPVLYELGLADALQWLARWVQENHGVGVTVRGEDPPCGLPEELRALAFQVIREMLLNVVKHAGTRRAQVDLESPDDRSLCLVVSDAGVGFDPASLRAAGRASGGFGLFSIRERVAAVGGRLEVDSAPGRGTRVTVQLPLADALAPAAGR
ncbi:MAG: ATP-binding protein [Candidatus Latescibacterota bacterium]